MNKIYIGLGSNLNNPIQQLENALAALSALPEITDLIYSNFYSSKPVGPQDQPDFVNAVASFSTLLDPIPLLDALQNIEQEHNRIRERHWGPRTLDLDILLINNDTLSLPRLTVPHPYMLERGFVIKPLADITPGMLLPNGKTVEEHLHCINTTDLVCL
ncbi:2-amino-4-hydroxy-6-hydroxymethyldihydropteridine diphosphokinase [Marinomonas sp. 2405UD68-3]|uniref:2-amino-4-hydroxy-6- hydroxymethyldihydropteridine diphosphokinase n=1 Tax=Marinomonas sp. 2405UD68-3 TaxID=3391835 RepID=UPI0039C9D50A